MRRITSVDAFRGFVMFLMLAEGLHLSGLAKHFPDSDARWKVSISVRLPANWGWKQPATARRLTRVTLQTATKLGSATCSILPVGHMISPRRKSMP